MKKLNLTQKKRKSRMPKKATFASKVKAVINKTAERKSYTTDGNFTNVASVNGFVTWNLLNGIVPGNSTAQRIGDKIFVSSTRARIELANHNILQTVANTDVHFRIILFRGKYDYVSTNYPGPEVFEGNAGSLPNNYLTAPIDLDQVTPLYDQIHTLTANNITGQLRLAIHQMNKMINKQFNFREDDSYQKNANLYLGVAQYNPQGQQVAVRPCVTLKYTDF